MRGADYLNARVKLMDYGRWRDQDLVIASGIVEGAARYVVGERLANGGMRWSGAGRGDIDAAVHRGQR